MLLSFPSAPFHQLLLCLQAARSLPTAARQLVCNHLTYVCLRQLHLFATSATGCAADLRAQTAVITQLCWPLCSKWCTRCSATDQASAHRVELLHERNTYINLTSPDLTYLFLLDQLLAQLLRFGL